MASRLSLLLDLLHTADSGALATNASVMAGYPFASAVAFAPDECHRPVFLISRLAEHTRNLAADSRASFLLARPLGEGEIARVTLLGRVVACAAEPSLAERYLRFHPEAERFLALGDFAFHRLEPARILVVGGFAKAGWLEGQRLLNLPVIPPALEANVIGMTRPSLPPGCSLLAVDAFGADLRCAGVRRRVAFAAGPVAAEALPVTVRRELAGG